MKICSNCKTKNQVEALYCQSCGNELLTTNQTSKPSSSPNKNKLLRILNWLLVILLTSGIVIYFISVKEFAFTTLIAIAFLLSILSIFIGTALYLNPELSYAFNYPLPLSKEKGTLFSKLLIVGNILLVIFGLMIVFFSLKSSQYLPSLSGFLYILLPFANIRAILHK